jgi:uncharacterized metal-binding protein
MTENRTCCGGTVRLVAACSGRSNVGQIANRLMFDMERMGILKGFCITGVGAGLSGFVESARAADLIMIDGCPTGCGKKVLENHGVEPKRYFVVTELLGITKGDVDDNLDADAKRALGQVMANI